MRIQTYLLAAAMMGGGLSVADGATIVSDNFDGYADQAAFEASWTPIGNGGSDQERRPVHRASQSVHFELDIRQIPERPHQLGVSQ